MTVDGFLSSLDRVRPTSKGFLARCPAHPDRSPSLSITEGDGRVLVHCFAGCPVEEIVGALGLRVGDLFHETVTDPRTICAAQQARRHKHRARTEAYRQELHAAALAHDAQQLVEAARGLDIAAWTEGQLDDAVKAVADAWVILLEERDVAA